MLDPDYLSHYLSVSYDYVYKEQTHLKAFLGILDTDYEVYVSQNSFPKHIYQLSPCVLLMK